VCWQYLKASQRLFEQVYLAAHYSAGNGQIGVAGGYHEADEFLAVVHQLQLIGERKEHIINGGTWQLERAVPA
jgi:hypothetical protein